MFLNKRKRIEKFPTIDNTWITSTKVRNYLLKDPILDWLDLYGKEKGYIKETSTNLSFSTFIMNQGKKFEKESMLCQRSKKCIKKN